MKLSFGQLARMADGSCVGSSGSTSVLVTTVGSDKPGSSQGFVPLTGKSLSEALIFASTNQQYDNRLVIELQVQYMKIPSSERGHTGLICSESIQITILTACITLKTQPLWL